MVAAVEGPRLVWGVVVGRSIALERLDRVRWIARKCVRARERERYSALSSSSCLPRAGRRALKPMADQWEELLMMMMMMRARLCR